MNRRMAAIVTVIVLGSVSLATPPVHADNDGAAGPDELADVAVPGDTPADTRPNRGANGQTTTLAVASGPVIEDFTYDDLETKGYAYDVCSGRLLPGSQWTFSELVDRFGGSPGTMYSCRERWDAANDPDCNGTVSNSSSSFYSTCWSNHAAGRAIDVMVGGSRSTGYNHYRGASIVNWLLAKDAYGNANANARRLGVQQILFEDRCWNSDGDRGIASWTTMRECGIGHHDHVHLDLTLDGAAGRVSFWGATPRPPAPRIDTQVLWDFDSAWRQAVSWHNLQETDEEGVAIPAGFDRALVGDWDGDRIISEVFLWDIDTGTYIVQEWNGGDSLNARMGQIARGFDDVVAGDFDNDGAQDDMVFWDTETGFWGADSWYRFNRTRRSSGRLGIGYDDWVSGDFDADGLVDDTLIWDHDTGFWRVHSWARFGSSLRTTGTFATGYDELVVGDWSAGGDMDDAILWDRDTGYFVVQSWTGGRPKRERNGYWGTYLDVAAPGDYDSDGRIDDLFVYDDATGRWWVYSLHRFVMSARRSGTWNTNFDQVGVGAFNV